MKKIILSMFCIFLLVGCSTKQENITIKKNNNQETVDLKVGFGLHHIEDGYSFDGNDVDINFDYEVVGRDANFGLMILINGIPQMIKHEDKESLVYTFKGKKDTNKTEHVSIMPNTGSKGDHLYMHAFLIADYEIVDSLKQLTNKQHMMACGTTFIDIHQDTANNPIDLNNNYDLIVSVILSLIRGVYAFVVFSRFCKYSFNSSRFDLMIAIWPDRTNCCTPWGCSNSNRDWVSSLCPVFSSTI